MSAGPTAKWLGGVADAALRGLTLNELHDRGFDVAIGAMRSALDARQRRVTDSWVNPPGFSTGGGPKSGSAGPIKSSSERSRWP